MVDEKKQNLNEGKELKNPEHKEGLVDSNMVLEKQQELQEKVQEEMKKIEENTEQANHLELSGGERLSLEQYTEEANEQKAGMEAALRRTPIEAGIMTPQLEKIAENYKKIEDENPEIKTEFIKNSGTKMGMEPKRAEQVLEKMIQPKQESHEEKLVEEALSGNDSKIPEQDEGSTIEKELSVHEKEEKKVLSEPESQEAQKKEEGWDDYVRRMHDIGIKVQKKLDPKVRFFWQKNYGVYKNLGEKKISSTLKNLKDEEKLEAAGIEAKDFFEYLEYAQKREIAEKEMGSIQREKTEKPSEIKSEEKTVERASKSEEALTLTEESPKVQGAQPQEEKKEIPREEKITPVVEQRTEASIPDLEQEEKKDEVSNLEEKMGRAFPKEMLMEAKAKGVVGSEEEQHIIIESLMNYLTGVELDGKKDGDLTAPTMEEVTAYVTGKNIEEVKNAAKEVVLEKEEAPETVDEVFEKAGIPVDEVGQTFYALPEETQGQYVEQLQKTYPELGKIETSDIGTFLGDIPRPSSRPFSDEAQEKITVIGDTEDSHEKKESVFDVSEAFTMAQECASLNEAEREEYLTLLKQRNEQYRDMPNDEIERFFDEVLKKKKVFEFLESPLPKDMTSAEKETALSLEKLSPEKKKEISEALIQGLMIEDEAVFQKKMNEVFALWNTEFDPSEQKRISHEVYEGMKEYVQSRAAQDFSKEQIARQIYSSGRNAMLTIGATTITSVMSGGSAAAVLGVGALVKFGQMMWKRGITEKHKDDIQNKMRMRQKLYEERYLNSHERALTAPEGENNEMKDRWMRDMDGLFKNALRTDDDYYYELQKPLFEFSGQMNHDEFQEWTGAVSKLVKFRENNDLGWVSGIEGGKARALAKSAKMLYEGATGVAMNRKALEASKDDEAMVFGLGAAAIGGAVSYALRSRVGMENMPLIRGILGGFSGLSVGVSLDEMRLHKIRRDSAEKVIMHLEGLSEMLSQGKEDLYENLEKYREDYDSAVALLNITDDLKLPKVFVAKLRNFVGEYQTALIRTSLMRREKAEDFEKALDKDWEQLPEKQREVFEKMQEGSGKQALKSALLIGGMAVAGMAFSGGVAYSMEQYRHGSHHAQAAGEVTERGGGHAGVEHHAHSRESSGMSTHEEEGGNDKTVEPVQRVEKERIVDQRVSGASAEATPLGEKYAVLLESGADMQKGKDGKIIFEIPFGEGAKQKNLENALDFLAAEALAEEMKKQKLDMKIDEVFATRMLNIGGGNLRAAFEGHGLQEVQKALEASGARIEDGKIIIPDYEKFEHSVLHPLVARSMENITAESVEKTGAVEYVPNINREEVLEKVRHGIAQEAHKKTNEIGLGDFRGGKHEVHQGGGGEGHDGVARHTQKEHSGVAHDERPKFSQKGPLIQQEERGPHGEAIRNEGEIFAPDYNRELGSDRGMMVEAMPENDLRSEVMRTLHLENTAEGNEKFNEFLKHYEITELMNGSSVNEKMEFAWNHQTDMNAEAVYRVFRTTEAIEKFIPQHTTYEQVKEWFDQGIQVRSVEEERMVLSFEKNDVVHMFTLKPGGIVSLENIDGSKGVFTSALDHAIFDSTKNMPNLGAKALEEIVLKMEMQAVGAQYARNALEELSEGKNWRGKTVELDPLTRERFLNAPVGALFDEKGKGFSKYLSQFEEMSRAQRKIIDRMQENLIPENQKQEIGLWLQKNPEYQNMTLKDALEAHFARIAGRGEGQIIPPHAMEQSPQIQEQPMEIPTAPNTAAGMERIADYNALNPKFSEGTPEGKTWLKEHFGKMWEDGDGKKYIVGKGPATTHLFKNMVDMAKVTALRAGGGNDLNAFEQRGVFVDGADAYIVFEIKK